MGRGAWGVARVGWRGVVGSVWGVGPYARCPNCKIPHASSNLQLTRNKVPPPRITQEQGATGAKSTKCQCIKFTRVNVAKLNQLAFFEGFRHKFYGTFCRSRSGEHIRVCPIPGNVLRKTPTSGGGVPGPTAWHPVVRYIQLESL